MQIIKLDATQSTNTYLKELAAKKELLDFTVVTTQTQTLGRGQFNTKWESMEGKNIAISVLKNKLNLSIDQVFLISISVSLAILDSLERLGIPKLCIKWPNDILSGSHKVGGILIENTISGTKIKYSIIGFGLNVNQESFDNIPHAASLKQIVGQHMDLDAVFNSLIENLNERLSRPLALLQEDLFKEYQAKLFKKGEVANFKIRGNGFTNGIIRGVTKNGKLLVELHNGFLQEFGLKEIQLQY